MGDNTLFESFMKCTTGSPPPCARNCPLGIDVLGMIKNVQIGLYSAANKIYARNAVFPGITSHICDGPCREVCVRKNVDTSIALNEIEKFCWEESRTHPEKGYYIPKKKKRVVIVGGGPAGMACGYKLAFRGYETELIERESRLGGKLWEIDDNILPKDILEEELARLDELKYLKITLSTEVKSLSEYDYDAALIAVGWKDDFDEIQNSRDWDVEEKAGIFYAGGAARPGQGPLLSIRDGCEVSYKIENFIKIGSGKVMEEQRLCEYTPDSRRLVQKRQLDPENPDRWSLEEIRREAERCELCSCTECIDVCPMLDSLKKSPKKIIQDVNDTINKTVLIRKVGLKPVMSCIQCGRCETVCPAGINLKELFMESRQKMNNLGQISQAYYDYWINDLDFSCSSESAFSHKGSETVEYLYFPGCQMGASDPDYVIRSYDWLRMTYSLKTAIMLYCCGAPAFWAADAERHHMVKGEIYRFWNELGQPTIVIACATCKDMFTRHFAEMKTISLWELMAEKAESSVSFSSTVSVFDPCASRYSKDMQKSVRRLLHSRGYGIAEILKEGDTEHCCGYGGLSATSNLKINEKMCSASARCSDYEYICYCTNCRDFFQNDGKECRHILDVLFFDDSKDDKDGRRGRKAPELSERRENRRRLKRRLGRLLMDVDYPEETRDYESLKLLISDELKEQLQRELILADNIKKTIQYAEKNRSYAVNLEENTKTAHLEQGRLTFWVRYTPLGTDTYKIHSVYMHRIKIQGAVKEGETNE